MMFHAKHVAKMAEPILLDDAVMAYTTYHKIDIENETPRDWLYFKSGVCGLPVYETIPQTRKAGLKKQKRYRGVRLASIPKEIGSIYNIPVGRKEEKSFYLSKPWRELRKRVISTYGCACMKCGFRNSRNHVDHIYPRSIYSHLELAFCNMQVLCKNCNEQKGNTEIYDVRPQKYQKLKDELLIMVIDSSYTATFAKQI